MMSVQHLLPYCLFFYRWAEGFEILMTNVQAISHNILNLFVLVADVDVSVKRTEQSKSLTMLMLLDIHTF